MYRRFQFDVHKPRAIRSVVRRHRTESYKCRLGSLAQSLHMQPRDPARRISRIAAGRTSSPLESWTNSVRSPTCGVHRGGRNRDTGSLETRENYTPPKIDGPPCGQRRGSRIDKQHSTLGPKNLVICHFFDLSVDPEISLAVALLLRLDQRWSRYPSDKFL